jgi:hypothetical protein
MKKLMLAIIIVMTVVMILGLSWGKLFKRGYTQDECGAELAKRDLKIEKLEDSIRIMQTKLNVYEQAVKWFRNADDNELQRGIKQIRSVPKDVQLP